MSAHQRFQSLSSGSAVITWRRFCGLKPLELREGVFTSRAAAAVPLATTSSSTGRCRLRFLVSSPLQQRPMPTLAKSSAGRVYKIFGCNATTSPVYLRLYNLSAAPTVGNVHGSVLPALSRCRLGRCLGLLLLRRQRPRLVFLDRHRLGSDDRECR